MARPTTKPLALPSNPKSAHAEDIKLAQKRARALFELPSVTKREQERGIL